MFAGFRAAIGAELSSRALGDLEAEQRALLDRLYAAAPDRWMLVAERNGAAIGSVVVLLDRGQGVGEIGLNAVHADHAGRGVGTALCERALAAMCAEGMRAATVNAGGDAAHAPARRAYQKAGFSAAIPSLWMARRL